MPEPSGVARGRHGGAAAWEGGGQTSQHLDGFLRFVLQMLFRWWSGMVLPLVDRGGGISGLNLRPHGQQSALPWWWVLLVSRRAVRLCVSNGGRKLRVASRHGRAMLPAAAEAVFHVGRFASTGGYRF
jgi:hypothetical protein